jgi:hypothetical protein
MQKGGKHLVLVNYAPNRVFHNEWVYNGADIDSQTVVFARSLGPVRDISVAKYYPTRHLWQAWLKPDGELDHLTTYDPTKKSALPATKG